MTTLRLSVLACTAAVLAACTRTVIVSPQPEQRRAPTAVTLGIPPGHLPRPGECRVWNPGTPPGRQPRPRSRPCLGISRVAPDGGWIVYRPTRDRNVVHVRVVDQRRPGGILVVRVFDIDGRYLRDEQPEPEDRGRPDELSRPDRRPREERPRPPDERPRPPEERPANPTDLGIPPGHLPGPGECRLWNPGTPPGLQRSRPTADCAGLAAIAPPGSWIIYRPTRDRNVVHVRVVDERRRGAVVLVRIFDIGTGRFLRDTRPEDEPRDDRPNIQLPDRDMPPIQRPLEQRPPDDKPAEQRPQDQRPPENKPPENKPPEQRPQDQRPPEQRPPERPQDRRLGTERGGPSTAATLGIPSGQLPGAGQCRVWIPGLPPGRQRSAPSTDCAGLARSAPAGSWVVYRPSDDQKVVHVRVVDERRAGVIVTVRVFDVESGRLLREENP